MSFRIHIICDRCDQTFKGILGDTLKETEKQIVGLGWLKEDDYHYCLDCNLKLKDMSSDDTRLSNLDELQEQLLPGLTRAFEKIDSEEEE